MDEQRPPQFRNLSGSASDAGEAGGGSPNGVRRLYRSSDRRMLLGVCGGLGEYFDLDPNLVRAVFAVLTLVGGGGLLLYVVLAFIMPSEDKLDAHPREAAKATVDEAVSGSRRAVGQANSWVRDKVGRGRS